MERQHEVDIDESYDRWQQVVSAVPEASDQERFLRHYYNAFRWDQKVKVDGIPRAIRSKIIAIYETLIKKDSAFIFEELCQKAKLYGQLGSVSDDSSDDSFDQVLRQNLDNLSQINATPAYQVLLYLFSLPNDSFLELDFLNSVVELFCKYYVRRNLTDFPPTRQLDQLHMDLVEACQNQLSTGQKLSYEFLRQQLLEGSDKMATLSQFESSLRGSVYASSTAITRYLLIKLNQIYHTREYNPDLWQRDSKNRFVWTIEHVLPKTENIPAEWVEMIAQGDLGKAKEKHEKYVHQLGNLTLSGFNSQLATSPFHKKQDLSQARKFLGYSINIGYKNGLALNQLEFEMEGQKFSLAIAPKWTVEMIKARTDSMVDLLLKIYTLER